MPPALPSAKPRRGRSETLAGPAATRTEDPPKMPVQGRLRGRGASTRKPWGGPRGRQAALPSWPSVTALPEHHSEGRQPVVADPPEWCTEEHAPTRRPSESLTPSRRGGDDRLDEAVGLLDAAEVPGVAGVLRLG